MCLASSCTNFLTYVFVCVRRRRMKEFGDLGMGLEDMLMIVFGCIKFVCLCVMCVGVDCCMIKCDVEVIFSWFSGVVSRETRTMVM